ncbi:MAG TPA: hypothetical protein VKZ18_10075 [Polyangia bacterium]|nr:hypothetical protein [Polyangia bacterium]
MPRSRWAILVAGAAAVLLGHGRAGATVGLAEWQIDTPGGHRITHGDAWMAEHGDCLLRRGDERPLVSHLVRWRYYPGLVLGRTTTDSFLLDERTEALARFPDERAALAALRRRPPAARAPLSDWMTADDGWTEAWFPLLVWPRCRQPATLDARTKVTCDRFLSPKGLALARVTTWGRACAALPPHGGAGGAPGAPAADQIAAWCALVTSSGTP